jgi:hypothetical protein
MKKHFFLVTAICGMMSLSACTEGVLNHDETEGSEALGETTPLLIHTRGDGDVQSRVYIFDSYDHCVESLSGEVGGEVLATRLPMGAYTVYAVGTNNFSYLSLPAQSSLTPTSVIAWADANTTADLLLAEAPVTLRWGQENVAQLNLELQRKVFSLDAITIHQVPDEVTAVSVKVSGLRGQIRLNGTYPEGTVSKTFVLTEGSDHSWSVAPEVKLLPSDDAPTIDVSFFFGEQEVVYTYTGTAPFAANTKVTLTGNYNGSQNISLRASLTAQAWDANTQDVAFDFDNSHAGQAPVVGSRYQGYYVVSVNETARKAVLLTKNLVEYTAPENSAPEADWLASFVTPMANLAKPSGTTADWRLPTYAEAKAFTQDNSLYDGDISMIVFYHDERETRDHKPNTLYWGYTRYTDGTSKFVSNISYDGSKVKLYPVIDIDY